MSAERSSSPEAAIATDLSLITLPVEILCMTLTWLDPVSLIAASQTSRSLRNIIKPTRNDFVQRLLALELLPEFGGIVPLFRARDNAMTPPLHSREWRRNKYACCVCLKLRSHMWFDNHSILRLGMRKPPPGSREATKLTDWEPLQLRDPAVRWRHAQRRAAEEEELRQPNRVIYHRFCTGADVMAGNYMRVNFGPIDQRAGEAERMLCGTERHKRACNSCRFLRGDWNHARLMIGSPPTVVIKSRHVVLPHILERKFPGLLEFLHERHPDKLSPPKIQYNNWGGWQEHHRNKAWSLFTVRCSSCSQWQELAGFGFSISLWRTVHHVMAHGPVPCNKCLQRKDPSAWQSKIWATASKMAAEVREAMANRLIFGWDMVYNDFQQGKLVHYNASFGDRILCVSPWKVPTPTGWRLKDSFIPELRVRLGYLRSFIRDTLTDELRVELVQSWFKVWLKEYELYEEAYIYMSKVHALIVDEPAILDDYVRERDPYGLSTS
ncbi:hypothetical protein B0T16DRAFT_418111 [Cercophora newfieldiana]|uniref:F-box domain-containing protein n=1 Tax=Cercophora newfieldiana TaxID=92897 RepID=A0AA39XUN5_9PEZI|nr:hypothetical protein B0T16DRAFT_418111 [Cercophora newfieldiana]